MGARTGTAPGTCYKAITASDTVENGKWTAADGTVYRYRAIRVDVAGTIAYEDMEGNTTTINGVAGEVIVGEFRRIKSTGTSATVHGQG